jgi:hypothetical protein
MSSIPSYRASRLRFILLPDYQFARGGGAPFQRSWPTSSEKRITHLSLLSFLRPSRDRRRTSLENSITSLRIVVELPRLPATARLPVRKPGPVKLLCQESLALSTAPSSVCFSKTKRRAHTPSIKTAVMDPLTERARSACRDADRSTHPPH